MKHIIFFLSCPLLLAYCSAPSQPEPHSTMRMYARYMQQEDNLRAEAGLESSKNGEAMLPVEIPGGIKFAGKPMQILPITGITYYLEQSGSVGDNQVFSWTDPDGKPREFALPLKPVANFRFQPELIDRTQPLKVIWDGKPIEKGEEMVFIWENLGAGQTVKMEIQGLHNTPEIEFPATKVAELQPGPWAVYLVRRTYLEDKTSGTPVSGIFEYYTATDTVRVK